MEPAGSYTGDHPRDAPLMAPALPHPPADLNDSDARERQRTMDVDIAMQMSRARRESSSIPIPGRQYSSLTSSPMRSSPEQGFTVMSPHEEETLSDARGDGITGAKSEGPILPDSSSRNEDLSYMSMSMLPHLALGHDPDLLVSFDQDAQPGADTHVSAGSLPMYQPAGLRSNFDFTLMEEFAQEERKQLRINSRARSHPSFLQPSSAGIPRESIVTTGTSGIARPLDDAFQPPTEPPPLDFARMRQRKLSHSDTAPMRRTKPGGKLALFEGKFSSAPPPSLVPSSGIFSNEDNDVHFRAGPSGWGTPGQGHDRPYRFSFYSNAISATIHARSLSELPAEGQTFEELFAGCLSMEDAAEMPPPSDAPMNTSRHDRVPNLSSQRKSRGGLPVMPENRPGTDKQGRGPADTDDWEANTWWLDILSPTDDEMRMISKVFSIHPLTTEDIQMEEAREKIELFRNYYLVCFRSFDQDPYSPMYLEPVNMYIVVFREGTLSFHFRPTPHPQNVRRRIKQLKDYISVSSDWISYALIDDITDAFGPLIKSIEYEVDSIDELVLILNQAEQSDMLRRIGTCRKKVMGLLRLMGSKADVVKGLAKRCNENWSVAPKSDIGLYLSDIQDHLITMTQNLNHYEKILSRSHSNYLAQISIEMTDANNQINDILSKLTALGTVLIPMNFITGLWGMNVHVPGQDVTEGYTWFFSIVGVLLSFAAIGAFLTYKLMGPRHS